MKKIILCLCIGAFTFFVGQSQNVVELSSGSGISLEDDQITSLETFATNTLPAFKDGNFKIIDASFYTYNDEMGTEREEKIWSNFQAEAKSKSPNYLLLGRQYFEDRDGFKLWVHLEVDIEDLECYDPEFKNEITEYIAKSQDELVEWYEYLSFKPETNGFEIVEQVAELGYYKLEKVCCEIYESRTYCSSDRLDPQQIADEKNLKYFILGRLRCLFDAHGCGSTIDVSNDNALNALTESSFRESQNSLFWQGSDILKELSFVHIYISENNTNTVSCNVTPDNTQTRTWYVDNDLEEDVEVSVYDIGKFTIVTERDKDLFGILNGISAELSIDLDQIVANVADDEPLKDEYINLLNYASLCDFLDLEEEEKYILLKLIVSEDNASWYEFWRWFSEKYPIFIRQLYDTIGEDDGNGYLNKKAFFEYQAQPDNIVFVNDLLGYDFPSAIKKQFFKDYCIDYYRCYFEVGGDPYTMRINGVPKDSIVYIAYEVDKFLNFYETNLRFDFKEQTGKVDFSMKSQYPEWHGNSSGTQIEWVKYHSENPFNPVCLTKIDIKQFSALSGILPAIVLPRIQEYVDDENFFNGIMLAVDVATTISVVGNVGKIRYLLKVAKVKLFFSAVEVGATLANNLIQYTDLIKNDSLKVRVSIFLALIEVVGAIGNGLSPLDLKKIQDEALDISKKLDVEPSADPKLAAGLRILGGGRADLLERILKIVDENHDLYKFVHALDEVEDAIKISRLSALAKGSLLKVASELKVTSKISKFTNDLAFAENGLELVLYCNVKPGYIKAWGKLDGVESVLKTDISILSFFYKMDDYPALQNKLLSNLDDAEKVKFVEDFADAPTTPFDPLAKINNDLTIVDDWKITKNLIPVTGGPTALAKKGNSQNITYDANGNPATPGDWDLFYENEAGDILAQKGYDIEQGPSAASVANRTDAEPPYFIPPPGKDPDFKLDSDNSLFFDVFSPRQGTVVRNVHDRAVQKLRAGQAKSFVINLGQWGGNLDDLLKQFRHWPEKGMRQVIIIDANKNVLNILQ